MDKRAERLVAKTHQFDQSIAECQECLILILNRTSG